MKHKVFTSYDVSEADLSEDLYDFAATIAVHTQIHDRQRELTSGYLKVLGSTSAHFGNADPRARGRWPIRSRAGRQQDSNPFVLGNLEVPDGWFYTPDDSDHE